MIDQIEGPASEPVRKPMGKLSMRTSLIAAALLAAGVGGGATLAHMTGPTIEMAPANPIAIKALTDSDGVVTVRGKVVETYGPMFILADGSGRALVELGRRGGGTGLVSLGQAVTVQGHFRDGVIHPSFLVGADGKVTALHPMGPRGGPGGPGGFRHDREGGPRGPEGRGPGGEPDRGGPQGGPDGPGAGPDGAGAPPPPPAAAAPVGNSAG